MFEFPIEYHSPVYRPPSEADSLLLQVTLGCSHNKCTFCTMYRTKKFKVRSFEEICEDIDKAKTFYQNYGNMPRRVFLCDGDALACSTSLLFKITEYLKKHYSGLERIGIYATARNILQKSATELKELAENKLSIAYLGLESGCDHILKLVNKGNTCQDMINSARKIKEAGWKLSVIAMLGLGGKEYSGEHCYQTARAVSEMTPDFFSFLTTTVVDGTPYHKLIEQGKLNFLGQKELLMEMHTILANIQSKNPRKIIFRANHISNPWPLGGILPEDKNKLLAIISNWINAI